MATTVDYATFTDDEYAEAYRVMNALRDDPKTHRQAPDYWFFLSGVVGLDDETNGFFLYRDKKLVSPFAPEAVAFVEKMKARTGH